MLFAALTANPLLSIAAIIGFWTIMEKLEVGK